MAYALACAHPDTFAAIASLAGATFAKPADCAPKAPVAVLQIHGTADDTVLFEGGKLDLGSVSSTVGYPGAEASVAAWAKNDGCATSSVVDEHVDVDAGQTVDGSPAEAAVTRWTGCRPGGALSSGRCGAAATPRTSRTPSPRRSWTSSRRTRSVAAAALRSEV